MAETATAEGLALSVVPLDVTSQESVDAAVAGVVAGPVASTPWSTTRASG